MKSMHALLASTLMMITGTSAAAAPTGPIVVELFTSQGCNSCPPADALLTELAHRPDVLALAQHVTYWNYLGWKDGFSQKRFDERQRWYSLQLQRGSYTPQMVINGAQDVVGSQRAAVMRALEKAMRPAAIALQVSEGVIEVSLPALEKSCDCEVTLFGVRAIAQTPVKNGENHGKTLEESRIVRDMLPLGRWKGEAKSLQVKLGKMPADVNAYAVVAQLRTTGRVVAAGQ